jgi:hypothetical protein
MLPPSFVVLVDRDTGVRGVRARRGPAVFTAATFTGWDHASKALQRVEDQMSKAPPHRPCST